MHGGKETRTAKVLSLVPESEHELWRTRVGSFAWRKMEQADRVVAMRAPASGPSVLAPEDQRLCGELRNTWAAFLLSHNDGCVAPWLVWGAAASDRHGTPLLSVKAALHLDQIDRPYYMERQRFQEIRGAALHKQWATHGRHDESWFSRWIEIDSLVSRAPPLLLRYALLAHGSAWSRRSLEFSIPEFIRAAEGVIAIPKGGGMKRIFCERTLRLVPGLRADEYVGGEIDALLPELYQLRSDCVHGKLPFETLQSRGPAGKDRAAQLAYVAEVLARESVLVALRHADWAVFESRQALEDAWKVGSFPR